jgi:hypothetical protein
LPDLELEKLHLVKNGRMEKRKEKEMKSAKSYSKIEKKQ